MTTCPVCNRPLPSDNATVIIAALPLGRRARRIFEYLARADHLGRWVSIGRIADYAYALDNELPEHPQQTVRVILIRYRELLNGTGLELVARMGRDGGYTLRWAK